MLSTNNRSRTLFAGGLLAAALVATPAYVWAKGGPAPGIPVPGSEDVLVEAGPAIRGLIYFDGQGVLGLTYAIFQGHCGKSPAFSGGAGFDLTPGDNPNPIGHDEGGVQVVTGPDDLLGRVVQLPESQDATGAFTDPNLCDPNPADGYEFAVVDKVDDFQLIPQLRFGSGDPFGVQSVFMAEVTLRPLVVWDPTSKGTWRGRGHH
jgi:hypothetical protein